MSTERVDTLKRFNYKLITNSYPTNKFVIKVAINFNPSNFNTNKKRKKNNKGEEKSYLRKKKRKRTFELLFSLFPIYTFLLIKLVYYKKKKEREKEKKKSIRSLHTNRYFRKNRCMERNDFVVPWLKLKLEQ